LPCTRLDLSDSLGRAWYRVERLDGTVVESPNDLFSLDDVDLEVFATG
jgi:hypothetical protein